MGTQQNLVEPPYVLFPNQIETFYLNVIPS